MNENDKPVLVYSTFPSEESAKKIGEALVNQRLAACVNILPAMSSIYRWEGRINCEQEAVMIIKTRMQRVSEVRSEVVRLHPYDNPSLLVLPVVDGAADFLSWIMQETERQEPAV